MGPYLIDPRANCHQLSFLGVEKKVESTVILIVSGWSLNNQKVVAIFHVLHININAHNAYYRVESTIIKILTR